MDHRSEVFALADQLVERRAALDPLASTRWGIAGRDHLLPDYSPARWEAEISFARDGVAALRGTSPNDEVDRIAAAIIEERLDTLRALVESEEQVRTFSVLRGPVADIRQIFELMPAATEGDAQAVAQRMAGLPDALAGWRTSLEETARREPLQRRQVLLVADQAATHAAGAYRGIAARFATKSADAAALDAAARDAEAALSQTSQWLRDTLSTLTTPEEAAGAERYSLWCRQYLGMQPDLEDLYGWGWSELTRINARMWELADDLAPGATSLKGVADAIDEDPRYSVEGVQEVLSRLEALVEGTVRDLDGVHFDIDERIRRCEVREAPQGAAAAPYYVAPSEDLSRPGTTWLPTLGATRFSWWRLVSIWYHEAVPGHHLQGASCQLLQDRQSRYQRLAAWTSGYGEGWALYAERLMEELGGFTDPANEMGYLSSQALRAARIVIDVGLHLGLRSPEDLGVLGPLGDCGARAWTPEMSVALLEERALIEHEFAVSEIDRYLGMPAQAISYKVGERAWLEARASCKDRLGTSFDLKAFHSHALRLGPMGLDPFRAEMDRWDGS